MFDRNADDPTAVASYDDEGLDAVIDWRCEHMVDGDTVTVWTHLKSNLGNSRRLEQFVARYPNVEPMTGRGGGHLRATGPVLTAWPDMPGIGMDAEAIEGWALANGWSGKNPERLGQYVRNINAGKRSRCRRVLQAGYVDHLRRRAAGGDD